MTPLALGQITANLPSRDFDTTLEFYRGLGFRLIWRADSWMVLSKEGMHIEFFPHPDLNPRDSWFSACLRMPEIDALHGEWSLLGISTDSTAIPRLTAITDATAPVPRIFYLVDPDGSLWRVIEDKDIR